jgi:hypothetical protein
LTCFTLALSPFFERFFNFSGPRGFRKEEPNETPSEEEEPLPPPAYDTDEEQPPEEGEGQVDYRDPKC